MRNLVDQDGSRGEDASLVGHHEGAGHCQTVSEVVYAIGYEVEVTCHLHKKWKGRVKAFC